MGRKPVSEKDLARYGRFLGSIDRNLNFRQQASNHNFGRNIRVAKLLGYLALLRQRRAPLRGIIECGRAVRQNFSSDQSMLHMGLPTGPTQAAHFLPGQIRIGGARIWEFANSPITRHQMEFLFAEVEHLPVSFNQADTAAEAKGFSSGLCSALVHACTTVMQDPAMALGTSGKFPFSSVRAGYKDWHSRATAALADAIQSKSAKPGIPPLVGDRFSGYEAESISARSTADPKLWNRDESLQILRYYLEDQQQFATGCSSQALREVELNFKG